MTDEQGPPVTDKAQALIFSVDGHRGLRAPSGIDQQDWSSHLAYQVARQPGNLQNHTRRIRLHLARKDAEALYGALLDLYLVLGDKGGALRGRLLRQARGLLSRERHDLFLTHYKHGLQRSQPLPASRHCVLGNFFTGKRPLVKRRDNTANATAATVPDPLRQARDEIIYGNVTEAQHILERALLARPEQVDLQKELLEIYLHTRSREDLERMREQLGSATTSAATDWESVRKQLIAMED